MSIRIKLKDWDIVVLPLEGKVLGRPRKDGIRKEIFTGKNNRGYHHSYGNDTSYPERYRSRLVWFSVNGLIPEGMEINHKNHNPADDRIEKLELVTPAEKTRYRNSSTFCRSISMGQAKPHHQKMPRIDVAYGQ